MSKVIDEQKISDLLEKTKKYATDQVRVREILAKARDNAVLSSRGRISAEYVQGLNLEDAATLLNIDTTNNELIEELFETALLIKQKIYGKRIVLFAPLYVSNLCQSGCLYCGYRAANKAIKRKILSDEEIIKEVEALEKVGHKRLLMLMGDHPQYTFDDFLHALEVASSVKTIPHGEIRRINVEIPSLTIEQFRDLKATNKVGTYALFQETYHRDTYNKMHPYGPKADYDWRLNTMDRALEGGMDDVGIGALFGLYDYRFEVLGLLMHAQHLDNTHNVGPHTISIPRLQPAINTDCANKPPCPVSDDDFKKLVAVIRCAVPYTGMILTTREPPQIRRALYNMGISQLSAGSRTEPGGYQKKDDSGEQFSLNDTRPSSEIIKELIEMGFIPSWCTACYRLGRTGEFFMNIAKQGKIGNYCQCNALLTLAEYLNDYADNDTNQLGKMLIQKEREDITSEQRQEEFNDKLEKVHAGQRDLYF